MPVLLLLGVVCQACTRVDPERAEAARLVVLLRAEQPRLDRASQLDSVAAAQIGAAVGTNSLYGVFMNSGAKQQVAQRLHRQVDRLTSAAATLDSAHYAITSFPAEHATNQVLRDRLASAIHDHANTVRGLETAASNAASDLDRISAELSQPCDVRARDFYACMYRRQTGGRPSSAASALGNFVTDYRPFRNSVPAEIEQLRLQFELSEEFISRSGSAKP